MLNWDVMNYSILSVVLFCGACYALIKSAQTPVPVINQTRYSKKALKIMKSYKVFSWSLMVLFLLGGLVMSFYQVFTQL